MYRTGRANARDPGANPTNRGATPEGFPRLWGRPPAPAPPPATQIVVILVWWSSVAQAGATASAEVKALYEKILAGKESETDRLGRAMDRAMQSVERVAAGATATERARKDEIKEVVSQGMDRMTDVAVTRAGTPGTPGGCSADVVCPQCMGQVPAGSRFCDNCGHKFFD